MQLDKNSWHVRLYRWWYGEKHGLEWTKRGYVNGANLCPYVRVILFWAPLRWIFLSGNKIKLWAVWLSVAAMADYILFLLVGPKGWELLKAEAYWVATTAFSCAVVLGVNWLKKCYAPKLHTPKPIKSFFTVLGARKQAFHDKICPILTFVEDVNNTATKPNS